MNEYFAALEPDRLAAELQHRVDAYYNWVLITGRLSRWRMAYDTHYGQRGAHASQRVAAGGKKGELSFLMSNEYRNLIQHLLVLAFQNRISLEMVATNTDSTSKAEAYVGKGIVEYFRRDGKIDANTRMATEISLIMDTGWVFNEWDIISGWDVAIDPDNGNTVRQGDIKSRAKTPLDVIVDFTKPQGANDDWLIVKDQVNKYDLAAQYPDRAEEITALQRDLTRDALFRFGDTVLYEHQGMKSPDIDVWTFYHRKSPALPNGRMFQFCSGKIHLFDSEMKYKKLPGNRICPTEQILSVLGYSNTNDLLALQDVIDAMVSSAVTNMTTVGVNNIWVKPGEDFDFEQLTEGMNLIEANEEPKPLILAKLPPEWFSLAQFIIARMEAISGVNAVARGNINEKNFSGAAMALLQSMSIQFNNGLMRAVTQLTEDNANDIIQLTQSFANEPKMGMIIGENNKYQIQEYSKKDIAGIKRVYARQSNALQDTTAGKMELLKLYQAIPNVVTSAAQITEVLETGQLSGTSEPGRNLRLAMDEENEILLSGPPKGMEQPPLPDGSAPNPVPVVFTDNHFEHIKKHQEVFASPKARADLQLMQRVKAHCDAHLQLWRNTDPGILMALGIPPAPPPLMPALPPGVMASGPGPGPAQNLLQSHPQVSPGAIPPSHPQLSPVKHPGQVLEQPRPNSTPANVNMPNAPTNPLTKEKWNPVNGGLQ